MPITSFLSKRHRLLMQLDYSRGVSPAGHSNLKRRFAQPAFAHSDSQIRNSDESEFNSPHSSSSTRPVKVPKVDASGRKPVISPEFAMPPSARSNASFSRSSAAQSWRSSTIGGSAPASRIASPSRDEMSSSKRTEAVETFGMTEQIHDLEYIQKTFGKTGLKPEHQDNAKGVLANWFALNMGSERPVYKFKRTVIGRRGYYRTTVSVDAEPTIVGQGDANNRKDSEKLAALSAVYELHARGLLDKKKKKVAASPITVATSVKLSDGSETDYERARQFMEYYCRRYKFSSPDIYCTPGSSRGNTHWEAVMTVDGRNIGMGKAYNKKDAQIQCYLDVTQYLESCDPQLWQDFVEAAKTGKDLGLAPKAFFQISDRLDNEIKDLCDNIRKSTLYQNTPKAVGPNLSAHPGSSQSQKRPALVQRRPKVSEEFLQTKSKDLLRRRQEYLANPAMEKMRTTRASLPVNTLGPQLLRQINENDVTICMATTGSGKTTQVPQMILDEWIEREVGAKCNVVCTQPRRIAAVSVADRVAKERGEKCGQGSVGYQVRFEAKFPQEHGSITFCTTGIFLKRMQSALLGEGSGSSGDLDDVTHIIVDEVHERAVDTDLLLVVLKRLLADRKARNKPLKVVLMSATIDPLLFQTYFPDDTGQPAKVFEVPGRSFPVEKYYLDDFLPQLADARETRWVFKEKSVVNYLNHEMGGSPFGSMDRQVSRLSDEDLETPHPLLALTILHVLQRSDTGHVLVFLPGWDDIASVQRFLLEGSWPMNINDRKKFSIHLLHSTIPLAEQEIIFEPPPEGVRRIILATNIAETSVTIPDVVYVVDAARLKEQRYDPDRRMSSLVSAWVGSSNLNQRAGRAGRHRPGQYFGILSRKRAEGLHPYQTVEMKRVDLSDIVMHVKALDFPGMSAEEALAATIEPPASERVTAAITDLEMVGALDQRQNLTSLGRVLLQLPIEVQMGRLILYGCFFRCLDQALTLAAIMSNRDPFVSPMHSRDTARERKFSFTPREFGSDVLAALNAYNEWSKLQETGMFMRANAFCVDNFLSKPTLLLIQKVKGHLLKAVYNAGVIEVSAGGSVRKPSRGEVVPPELNANGHSMALLVALITIASQPKFAIHTHSVFYRTQQDKNVQIHPSSVNASSRRRGDYSGWDGGRELYAYTEKRQNLSGTAGQAQKFIVTTTRLDPMTYVLFGAYEIQAVSRALECDEWLPVAGSIDALDDIRRLKMLMEASMLRVFEGLIARQSEAKLTKGRFNPETEEEFEEERVDSKPLSMTEVKELDSVTQDIVRILNKYNDELPKSSSRPQTPVGGGGGSWTSSPRIRGITSGHSTPYSFSRSSTPSQSRRF